MGDESDLIDDELAGARSELSDERRAEIELEAMGAVAADFWRTIDRRMRELEGEGWHGGEDPELCWVLEGPDEGRLFWKVGRRKFTVDEYVVEQTPARRRVIGREGVIAAWNLIRPDLN